MVRPDTARAARNGVRSVTGSLAGQDLYFEPGISGAYHALGAIPISAPGTAALTLTITYGDGEPEHRFERVPVKAGDFMVERLRVSPRFVEAPDSALTERIARERNAVRAAYRRARRTPRLWRGTFQRPVPGPVTSGYGTRREFNGQLQSRHWGVDLDGQRGDSVVAANRGVVALTGDFYYSGRVVYLDHGHGLVTGYLHLSEILVAIGDTVACGQPIGRIGATGRVTGPHLHWLARYGGLSVNPLSALDLDLSGFDPAPPVSLNPGARDAPHP